MSLPLKRSWWVVTACLMCAVHAVAQSTAPELPEHVRSSQYVTVRDGTQLAMNVYRPANAGVALDTPLPVIFLFSPYRARYRNAAGAIVELSQVRSLGLTRLLEAGYVIAEADIRGKGASFGARRGFQDRTEAWDGHDLVQWLAGQSWSNGVVGMAGCSYLGGSTLHVASTRPPALKAMFVGASDLDKYAFVRSGGITAQFNTRPDEPLSDDLMSVPMDADSDGSLLRRAVSQHVANTPMAQLWYGMPFRDSVSPLTGNRFWEEVGPYTWLDDLKASGIAAYFWSNLKDEPTAQMILAAANIDSKLLVGPGGHCAPPPGFDLGAEVQRFFDLHLKGIDTGIQHEPPYRWWVENAAAGSEWKQGSSLPGSQSSNQTWYFGADDVAGLATTTPATAQRSFTVDYNVGNEEYFSFWVEPQDEHGLTWTSAPLARDLHLEGYPVVHVKLSADSPEVNVFAYLEEVDASGKVEVLASGRLAASYRALAQAPYETLGLPWHAGRAADFQPLEPGETVVLDIALLPVSRIVASGQRLRMTLTGADPRQRNLADIRQDPAPTLSIQLGGANGTHVVLPVLE
jgi:uncharacterized protein